ncbi:hypothetical protein BJX62DRAFT_199078, partial [Aspergillus germanicus]
MKPVFFTFWGFPSSIDLGSGCLCGDTFYTPRKIAVCSNEHACWILEVHAKTQKIDKKSKHIASHRAIHLHRIRHRKKVY